MVNQACYKNNRSIQFSFGVVMLSSEQCDVNLHSLTLENIDNNLTYYERPTQLACAYLKCHLTGRALDWFEVQGYGVVEDKATGYAHLKQALTEKFPVVRNKSEPETRFYASSQERNQKPFDFVYDLLKIHKQLKLEMTEEKMLDHVISSAAASATKNKIWSVLLKPNCVPDSPRTFSEDELRLLTGHDYLCAHLFVFTFDCLSFMCLIRDSSISQNIGRVSTFHRSMFGMLSLDSDESSSMSSIIARPHLTKSQRLPRTYKEVEKILKDAKACRGTVRNLMNNSRLRGSVFKKVYALSVNVLKHRRLLDQVIKDTQLLEREPSLREELAGILVYELIFGKGLPGESRPVTVVKNYRLKILDAYQEAIKLDSLSFKVNRLEYIKLYCRNSNLGHHTGQANAVRGINADQIRRVAYRLKSSTYCKIRRIMRTLNTKNKIEIYRRAHTLGDKPKKVPSESDNGGKEIQRDKVDA
ncbi:uncharacterized protein TNCV_4453531 [Trichonephila clavipes]|nr:uncharacterized protein TNCV_4453531 [Trichonephila clavipes]